MHKKLLTAATLSSVLVLSACGENSFTVAKSMQNFQAPKFQDPSQQYIPGKVSDCRGEKCTSLAITGDIILNSPLWDQAKDDAQNTKKGTLDFNPMMAYQNQYLKTADTSVCQLDSPVAASQDGPFSAEPQMNVPPQIINGLKDTGYKACVTSGQHTNDQETDGINRTLKAFKDAGLATTGSYSSQQDSQNITMLNTDAAKIALISSTTRLAKAAQNSWQVDTLSVEQLKQKAQQAKNQGADIVVVSYNTGDDFASSVSDASKNAFHQLLDDANINAVYGTGTHSVLPLENYNNKWALYSLGNSVNAKYDDDTQQAGMLGLLARLQFTYANGHWFSSDIAWVPSTMGRKNDPYRWCSLAQDKPQGICFDAETDQANSATLNQVVNSMGADKAGAHQLTLQN